MPAAFDPPPRYHLSGEKGRAPAAVALTMLVGGAIVGYLAGRASVHVDEERFVVGAAFLLGLGVGAACNWFIANLHCRSKVMAFVYVALGGFSTAWFMTLGVASEYLRMGAINSPVSDIQMITNPSLLLNTLDAIANAGVILRRNRFVSPGSLWTGWTIQALMVLVIAVATVAQSILRQVFCEDCQAWLDISRKKLFLPCPSNGEERRLKSGDLSTFLEQPLHKPIHASRPPFMRIDYVLCNKCGNTGAFRIVQVTDVSTHSMWSFTLMPWWMEKNQFKEINLTPLLQLTPGAAQDLGQLMVRDKETKDTRPAMKPNPAAKPKPVAAARPKAPPPRPLRKKLP